MESEIPAKKKVMVFGVFDRLHRGHLDFLRQARKYGDELIAVVARDKIVMELKNKTPFHSEQERLAIVQEVPEVTRAVLGDEVQGSYGVITVYKPDVICVGYDQQELAEDLAEKMASWTSALLTIVQLEAYCSDKFHTSHLT